MSNPSGVDALRRALADIGPPWPGADTGWTVGARLGAGRPTGVVALDLTYPPTRHPGMLISLARHLRARFTSAPPALICLLSVPRESAECTIPARAAVVLDPSTSVGEVVMEDPTELRVRPSTHLEATESSVLGAGGTGAGRAAATAIDSLAGRALKLGTDLDVLVESDLPGVARHPAEGAVNALVPALAEIGTSLCVDSPNDRERRLLELVGRRGLLVGIRSADVSAAAALAHVALSSLSAASQSPKNGG